MTEGLPDSPFNKLARLVYSKLLGPLLVHYVKRDRDYTYKKFRLHVSAGVFHPGLFFSSRFFSSFLETLSVEGTSCLEIGCGSGLLSMVLVSKGARVKALDINPAAVKNTMDNFSRNKQLNTANIQVIESDLFGQLMPETFDTIVVNPPYYFADPTQPSEFAWYCGSEGDYFRRLFAGLRDYMKEDTNMYMSLSDKCDLNRIRSMAALNRFTLKVVQQKRIWGETNFIFSVKSTPE